AVPAFHAGAVQLPPPGVGDVVFVGDGWPVGGVAPPNLAVNLVNSQSLCATLEQVPDVVPGSGTLHCRSRLTDQYVYLDSPWVVAAVVIDTYRPGLFCWRILAAPISLWIAAVFSYSGSSRSKSIAFSPYLVTTCW